MQKGSFAFLPDQSHAPQVIEMMRKGGSGYLQVLLNVPYRHPFVAYPNQHSYYLETCLVTENVEQQGGGIEIKFHLSRLSRQKSPVNNDSRNIEV